MADELPGDMAADRDSLREFLSRAPLLQLLANWTVLHYTGPGTVREGEIPPFLGLEYLTWLGITLDPPPPLQGDWIQPEVYNEIDRLLGNQINGTQWRISTDHLRREVASPTPLEEAVFRARLHHLFVRLPAYAAHRKEQLEALFGPFSAELRAAIGFDIESALDLIEAAGQLVERMLNERIERARRIVDRLSPVLSGRAAEEELDDEERRMLAAIRARGAEDPVGELESTTTAWLFFGVELAFTLSPSLLADEAGCDEETARSFLKHFSLTMPQPQIGDGLPSVYEPLQQAPLIDLGNDTWFCPLTGHLWEAVRPSFEALIAADTRLWGRYERHRSQFVETRALELLAQVSPHSATHHGLTYEFDDGEGVRRYELDGLVVVDRVGIVLEAKAGTLRPAARRGAAGSLVDDLEALIGEAQHQAARAARFIRSQSTVTFESSAGDVTVSGDALDRLILVTVSLDELLVFTTHVASIKDLVDLPADVRAWAVSLSDLRVITELVEGMGQLIHYLDRRLALEELDVATQDELDWFGHYLDEGLFFDPSTGHLIVGTYTDAIDAYYMSLAGAREEPADIPRQKMPPLLRELMVRLEQEGPEGFVEAVVMLLDGGTDERQLVARNLRDRRERAAITGFAGFRVGLEDGKMLVYAAGVGVTPEFFRNYVAAAKYTNRRDTTIGILESVGGRDPLVVHMVAGAWHEDEAAAAEAERVLHELETRPMPVNRNPKPKRKR
jgi:hypothetical protein